MYKWAHAVQICVAQGSEPAFQILLFLLGLIKCLRECWGVNWSLWLPAQVKTGWTIPQALSGRTDLKVHHWLLELRQISSSCIVKTWPLLHREAKLFDLIKFSPIILKENFSPRAPQIFTEADYLTWVECLILRQRPLHFNYRSGWFLRKSLFHARVFWMLSKLQENKKWGFLACSA